MFHSKIGAECFIFLILFCCYINVESTFRWLQVPGTVQSLEGGNASLIWVHNGPSNVDIEWSFKGTPENPQSDVILLNKKGQEIPYGDKAERLNYIRYDGSATMFISNLTRNDEGGYEVKVIHPTEPIYIDDIAQLRVYYDLNYNITVDDVTYDCSLDNNGTSITLPSSEDQLPHIFNVSASISSAGPKSLITLEKWVGTSIQEMTSLDGYYLNRLISFGEKEAKRLDADVFQAKICISLDFQIQNLPNITVTMTVSHGADLNRSRFVTNVLIGSLLSVCMFILFTTVILSLKRDQLRNRETVESFEVPHQTSPRRTRTERTPTEEPLFMPVQPGHVHPDPEPSFAGSTLTRDTESFRMILQAERGPLVRELVKIRNVLESTMNIHKMHFQALQKATTSCEQPSSSWVLRPSQDVNRCITPRHSI